MRNSLLRDDSGQAVIEYVLAVAMVIAFISILAAGFRRIVLRLWVQFAGDISAACPGCPKDPKIR